MYLSIVNFSGHEIKIVVVVVVVLILSTVLLQKMRARVTRDGTKCAKNSTFNGYDIYFDEVNPIGLLPRFICILLLVKYKNVILCNFAA